MPGSYVLGIKIADGRFIEKANRYKQTSSDPFCVVKPKKQWLVYFKDDTKEKDRILLLIFSLENE